MGGYRYDVRRITNAPYESGACRGGNYPSFQKVSSYRFHRLVKYGGGDGSKGPVMNLKSYAAGQHGHFEMPRGHLYMVSLGQGRAF